MFLEFFNEMERKHAISKETYFNPNSLILQDISRVSNLMSQCRTSFSDKDVVVILSKLMEIHQANHCTCLTPSLPKKMFPMLFFWIDAGKD